MMRCLVTGGCGFVGSALVRRLLEESCEVLVVDDLSRGSRENLAPDADRVSVIQQDVTTNLSRIFSSFQPQAVFHLAALHFIPDCDADPTRCLRVNVDGRGLRPGRRSPPRAGGCARAGRRLRIFQALGRGTGHRVRGPHRNGRGNRAPLQRLRAR
jgi:hypothetical protein